MCVKARVKKKKRRKEKTLGKKLTGKNNLWEAHGLKSFFHSAAFSLGKVIGYNE